MSPVTIFNRCQHIPDFEPHGVGVRDTGVKHPLGITDTDTEKTLSKTGTSVWSTFGINHSVTLAPLLSPQPLTTDESEEKVHPSSHHHHHPSPHHHPTLPHHHHPSSHHRPHHFRSRAFTKFLEIYSNLTPEDKVRVLKLFKNEATAELFYQ
jgi:hypothetical protein